MDEKAFAALAREAELRVVEFNAQDVAMTTQSFRKLGWTDDKLFAALERQLVDLRTSKHA